MNAAAPVERVPKVPVASPPAPVGESGTPGCGSKEGGTARTGVRMAWVLGVFLAAVAVVMVAGQWTQSREEPWRSAALAEARAKLLSDPKDESLKTTVRALDQELRQSYFRSLERNRTGAWLLLGGAVALVGVARFWCRTTADLPDRAVRPGSEASTSGLASAGRMPGRPTGGAWVAPDREQTRRRAVLTVWIVGGASVVGLFLAGGLGGVRLPERGDAGVAEASGESAGAGVGSGNHAEAAPTSQGPSAENWARNWPGFRGPEGSGRLGEAGVPTSWNVKTGEGVVWKASLPLKGYNSPVVWNDRVFVTGGNREQRLVFAFDAGTGTALWARPVTPTNVPVAAIDPPDQSGQAASTAATDGERVFAVFATGEIGALDFAGNLVWHHRLDFKENGYGHASSLVVWRDRLLVQADQGAPEDGKSSLQALDTRTGKVVWNAKRPVGGSWATPLVIEHGGRAQVVTAGDPWLMAHDAVSGAEVWRANVLGGELAPSPVFGAGRIFATSPGHALVAVGCDGTGDVTASRLVWKLTEEVPDVPTPTLAGDLLFTANTEGHVICRDAATGAKLWDHAFEMEIQASPLVVGDRLFVFAQPGNVAVAKVARTFESLASFEMGEDVFATPAVAADRFLIRTDRNLYCVGTPGGSGKGEKNDVR